jgi:hypothetical protein
MISLEDCVALCGLTEEQVLAIAEHEHLPEIAATALAQYLLKREHGMEKIRDMIVDDIRRAQQRQDKASGRSTGQLILKRASASRLSGQWKDDDFDVLADGVVVGRILKANAAPVGSSWMWALAFGFHEDRTPTHGFAETREAAMAAFAKSWRRAT